MVRKSWTDQEIISIIRSNSPSHMIEKAWNTLVKKYQDELEDMALELWDGDDFLVSDTLDRALVTARTWIQAYESLDSLNGDLRQWVHSILRQQFCQGSGNHHMKRNHVQSPLEEDYDWAEDELSALENESSRRDPFYFVTDLDDLHQEEATHQLLFQSEILTRES